MRVVSYQDILESSSGHVWLWRYRRRHFGGMVQKSRICALFSWDIQDDKLTPSLASIHLVIAGTDAPVRGLRSRRALVMSWIVAILIYASARTEMKGGDEKEVALIFVLLQKK